MNTLLSNTTLAFESVLDENGAVNVPEELPIPKGVKVVEGILNHFPFRSFLRSGSLEFSSAMQTAARAKAGKRVVVEVTRVDDEAETRVPRDLADALTSHPKALEQWEDTTTKARRDWILWLLTAKQQKTRETRIEKACDMLASGKGRVCCFGGLNWLVKDEAISKDETWQL